jgi:hypothetical protein
MKNLAAAIALLCLSNSVLAHDIYTDLHDRDGNLCCGRQDCTPVEVTVLPNGSYFLPKTGEIIPADMAMPSPDNRFHKRLRGSGNNTSNLFLPQTLGGPNAITFLVELLKRFLLSECRGEQNAQAASSEVGRPNAAATRAFITTVSLRRFDFSSSHLLLNHEHARVSETLAWDSYPRCLRAV